MTGMQAALIDAHEKNLSRYARLLATELTETERRFVHGRIAEERLAVEQLRGSGMPPAWPALAPDLHAP